MGAVWYRARGGMRHRWIATIALVLFVALPAGVVLASIAGARRGSQALPDFLDYHRASNVLVFTDADAQEGRDLRDEIAALPQWEAVGQAGAVVVAAELDDGWATTVAMSVLDTGRGTQNRPLVVDGRLPDPDVATEVTINEAFAEGTGLRAGDTLPLRSITPGALEAVANGQGEAYDPDGETIDTTITAVVRAPTDLRAPTEASSDDFLPDSWRLDVGPAFVAHFGDDLANYGFGVAGRVPPDRLTELSDAITGIGGDRVNVSPGDENAVELATIDRGIDFETSSLLLFAALAGVTTLALVGQAVGRQAQLELDDDDALRATGLTRRERVAVPLVRIALVVAAGTAGAIAVAVALSGTFPIGLARRAELESGIEADWLVLVPGAAGLAVALLVWATVISWRATGPAAAHRSRVAGSARTSGLVNAVTTAGAPITVSTGVRLAVQRGQGRSTVPVVGAFAATTAGVLVLCAVLVFGTSLNRLVDTPSLQGWTWDVSAGNFDDATGARRAARALRTIDEVDAFVGVGTGPVILGGLDSYLAFVGPGDVATATTVLEGRMPATDTEIAVGRGTLDDLDLAIGDDVELQVGPGLPVRPLRIVGTVVPPASTDTQLTLSRGAVITLGAAQAAYPSGELLPQAYLVRFAEGVTVDDGTEALRPAFGEAVTVPRPPGDVANLSRVQRLPRLLAALVALLALGTLANALVTSVRRHRRDLATFATLGFRRRQLAGTVAWQATTFALLALILGIPLGVALGRTVWRVVMDSIGTVVAPSVPLGVLAAVALITLLAANAIAALPARSAARTKPAQVFRSE